MSHLTEDCASPTTPPASTLRSHTHTHSQTNHLMALGCGQGSSHSRSFSRARRVCVCVTDRQTERSSLHSSFGHTHHIIPGQENMRTPPCYLPVNLTLQTAERKAPEWDHNVNQISAYPATISSFSGFVLQLVGRLPDKCYSCATKTFRHFA